MADATWFIDNGEDALIQQHRVQYSQQQSFNNAATPEQGQGVARIAASYPGMQPGAALAFGSSGLQPGDPIVQQAAANIDKVNAKKKSLLHRLANGAVRQTMATLEAPYQFYSGAARYVGGAVDGQHGFNPGDLIQQASEQTNLGQSLAGLRSGQRVDQGEGFFVNPESRVGQMQAAAARDAMTIDGHGATLGRAVASTFFEPDDDAYRYASGLLDAASVLMLDPVNKAGGGVAAMRAARKTFTPESAGFFQAARKFKLDDMANEWLDSRAGNKVVDWLSTNSNFDDIWKTTGRKWDVGFAAKMADETDPEVIKEMMRAEITAGRLRDKPYQDSPFTSWKPVGGVGISVKRRLEDIRMFNQLPGNKYILNDANQAVQQLDSELHNANMDASQIAEWNGKLARATTAEERRSVILDSRNALRMHLMGATGKKLNVNTLATDEMVFAADRGNFGRVVAVDKDAGTAKVHFHNWQTGARATVDLPVDHLSSSVRAENAQKLTRMFDDVDPAFRAFNVDEFGNNVPVRGLTIDGAEHTVPGAHLLVEGNDEMLPGMSREDIVNIRTMTSKLAPVLKAIDVPERVLRSVTNVWKPMVLLRGAYTVRVVGEEQVRMAANGLTSLVNHPLSAISWIVGDPKIDVKLPLLNAHLKANLSFADNIPGVSIGRGQKDIFGKSIAEEAEAENGLADFTSAMNVEKGGDDWRIKRAVHAWLPNVQKGSEHYKAGWTGELHQLRSDPVAQRVAGGFRPGDLDALSGNDVEDAIKWFTQGAGAKFRGRLSQRRGWEAMAHDDEVAAEYVRSIHDRIVRKTDNDSELRDLIGHGTINGEKATLRTVRNLLDRKELEGVGPQGVKVPVNAVTAQEKALKDKTVDFLFDHLMTKPTNFLSRSPAFRQFYWQRIAELTPSMTPKAQAQVLKAAQESQLAGKDMKRLQDYMKAGTGDIDLDGADTVAKAFGLDETQKLLYNPNERTQLFDMLRLIMPFGEAWKEVLSVWAKTVKDDPSILRKGEVLTQGARDAGFFSTDENGNETFTFPLSGKVNKWITGTETPFKANVKGLNIFSNNPLLPGISPFISWPLSTMIPNKPDTQFVRDLIAPMGGQDTDSGVIESFAPAWAKKLLIAGFGDPESDRMLNSSVGRIMQHKLSTGAYSTSTPEEIDKLRKDSIKSARLLMVLRAGTQWWAPSAPSPKWTAKDAQGNLTTVDALMKDFRQFQEEDYETADQKFLDQYGEEALLYLQPLSQGGFQPLEQLHDWVRDNGAVATRYKNTYGFFAPQGGEYSANEQERQIATGERRKLRSDEIVALANGRVARLKYNQARDSLSAKPTVEERLWLKEFQEALAHDYPGYNPDTLTQGKVQQRVRELKDAVGDALLKDNKNAATLRKYMEARDYAESQDSNFQNTKRSTEIRAWLREVGTTLSAEDPNFKRVWLDVLDRELKDDTPIDTTQQALGA